MAKSGPCPDDIMAPAQMKAMLMVSKHEPVNAAVAMTTDRIGVLLLHKKTRPKKLLADLRARAKKIQLGLDPASVRFGTAEVDTEIDSALVRFRINKEAPGQLGPRLRESLKPAGFQKVEFVIDPSLEDESEDEATAEGAPSPTPEGDWAALTLALTELAKHIAPAAGGNAERQHTLVQLANAANAHVKARADILAAQQGIEALRAALEAGGETLSGAKTMPVWQTAKDSVDDQLRALSDKLRKTGIPELADVSGEVETLLDRVRVGVVTALMGYDSAPNETARAAALSAIEGAIQWLGTDARIRAVDGNPFGVTVSAVATLGGALRQLQSQLAPTAGVSA